MTCSHCQDRAEGKRLTTADPKWLKRAAEYWEERYRTQHKTLHSAEDEISHLRAELARVSAELAHVKDRNLKQATKIAAYRCREEA